MYYKAQMGGRKEVGRKKMRLGGKPGREASATLSCRGLPKSIRKLN